MNPKTNQGYLFGCCRLWNVCKMGQEPCPRFEEEPDYVAGCDCFKRYIRSNNQQEQVPDFMGVDKEGQGYLL
ncbi:hypothetical protein [Aneurinibacillus aneurinilyticus]|uniref:Uncharacterized protein n=1 Tax=Aneurinibacillus aneurinilyticus ATCC 12856 TaxID=649747 RepID=U1Y4Y4_ANEAE|nr:hypothetical protein [Aneurinibacillus aneurinilyticus]ERI07217.1 hypothetical protein HMPREF0083_04688 [Aneurinibacillus aneurinilyticus ATCC 12856]MED0706849.1 hypothetical protein [Aneurinibacillus aneurinilyticus]MED0725924.1 hypothetical protein [Aneurinibacillus aneurinilyticus]MED0730365.1 hypothetical protein [Aneurinibacillus aneurinilyticus]MED0739194.1 hypothetical protein [Aneurinibacillus aneurinilyticus]